MGLYHWETPEPAGPVVLMGKLRTEKEGFTPQGSVGPLLPLPLSLISCSVPHISQLCPQEKGVPDSCGNVRVQPQGYTAMTGREW